MPGYVPYKRPNPTVEALRLQLQPAPPAPRAPTVAPAARGAQVKAPAPTYARIAAPTLAYQPADYGATAGTTATADKDAAYWAAYAQAQFERDTQQQGLVSAEQYEAQDYGDSLTRLAEQQALARKQAEIDANKRGIFFSGVKKKGLEDIDVQFNRQAGDLNTDRERAIAERALRMAETNQAFGISDFQLLAEAAARKAQREAEIRQENISRGLNPDGSNPNPPASTPSPTTNDQIVPSPPEKKKPTDDEIAAVRTAWKEMNKAKGPAAYMSAKTRYNEALAKVNGYTDYKAADFVSGKYLKIPKKPKKKGGGGGGHDESGGRDPLDPKAKVAGLDEFADWDWDYEEPDEDERPVQQPQQQAPRNAPPPDTANATRQHNYAIQREIDDKQAKRNAAKKGSDAYKRLDREIDDLRKRLR